MCGARQPMVTVPVRPLCRSLASSLKRTVPPRISSARGRSIRPVDVRMIPRPTREKNHAQLLLEQVDVLPHGRLCEMEPFARRCVAARSGCLHEGCQVAEFHRSSIAKYD